MNMSMTISEQRWDGIWHKEGEGGADYILCPKNQLARSYGSGVMPVSPGHL